MDETRNTDDEIESAKIERAMLDAAWAEFDKLGKHDNADNPDAITRATIRAIAAARRAERNGVQAWITKSGKRQYVVAEPQDAVATAYYMWSSDTPIDDTIKACSVAAGRLLGFAAAFAACQQMGEASYAAMAGIEAISVGTGAEDILTLLDLDAGDE